MNTSALSDDLWIPVSEQKQVQYEVRLRDYEGGALNFFRSGYIFPPMKKSYSFRSKPGFRVWENFLSVFLYSLVVRLGSIGRARNFFQLVVDSNRKSSEFLHKLIIEWNRNVYKLLIICTIWVAVNRRELLNIYLQGVFRLFVHAVYCILVSVYQSSSLFSYEILLKTQLPH